MTLKRTYQLFPSNSIRLLFLILFLLTVKQLHAQIQIGGSIYGGGNAGATGGSSKVTVYEGNLHAVFAGARMADVGGSAFVHIDGEHASDYILIDYVYGGNDIAGTIGTSENLPLKTETSDGLTEVGTEAGKNDIDNSWNAFVRISPITVNYTQAEIDAAQEGDDAYGKTTSDTKNKVPIYIGQLFGGGNGYYDYDTSGEGTVVKNKGTDDVVASSPNVLSSPELRRAYLEILGGSIVYAYGGGNNATITEKTVICVDNPSKVVNSIKDTRITSVNGGEQLTDARFKLMRINTGFSYPSSDEFQIGRFFGGNNKAEMAIRPTWNLKRGLIRNLYSGGNQGAMTYPKGILLVLDSPNLKVDNVYGGCRMADVNPAKHAIEEEIIGGVTFPAGYAARLLVNAGDINNVYGGNDVTGNVYGGNAVGIHCSIKGNVYGGGNGSYPYTDKAVYKNHDIYSDIYYDPGTNSTMALNAFRPNAESVSIRVVGTDANHPTVIGGAIYCGGNSATLHADDPTKAAELKIGSYVIADKVFLGNNGENMVTNDILTTMKTVNSIDLTDGDNFKAYMDAVAMDVKPRVVFDDNYEAYSTKFGSFYCGGNVGSMKLNGAVTINFNDKVIVFEKLVGGSNDANVSATTYNAEYLGGLLGDPAPVPEGSPAGTIGNKLILNFGGLKIQPMRWKVQRDENKDIVKDEDGNVIYIRDKYGNRILEWNTISAETGKDVDPVTDNSAFDATKDLDRRLKGGNIYGGCYNSGHVNGNVIINLNASIVDRKGEFAIFDKVEENEGEAILYGNESYNILERRSGVILDEQGMDVLGKALNVFGGGYGAESEIWGSTTINLNAGYTFQIFGGGEKGAIGKKNDEDQYEYDPKYSCYVNMKGSSEGVYRGHVDDSDDMAEAEFIYGGSFEAPIAGNTVINLGNGRIFNSFAGSCNADILGHTETYVGRSGVDANGKDVLGFPWVRDHVYGGNDLGGQIKGSKSFIDRVDVEGLVHNPENAANAEVANASAYMEYIQGRVDYIFGGCYGDYDYTSEYFKDYTYTGSGKSKDGFTKPRLDNAFVNFRPNTHARNAVTRIFGAGQGKLRGIGVDSMQNRSYVLVEIPQTIMKFQNVEVFGAGANCGLGMGVKQTADETPDGKSIAENPDNASAIIDLARGQINAAYGGSFKEGITRRTVVNVPNGSTISLNNIFGGAFGADPMYPCDVYEAQVNYHSEGARVKTIYGGNNSADRTLYGQVNISVPVWQNKESGYLATVFGAGYGKDTWSQYTEVNLNNGARVYEVYGGGNNGKVLNTQSLAQWRHDEGEALDLSIPGYEAGTIYKDKDNKDFKLDAGLDSPLAHAARLDGKKYNTNVHIHQGATVVNYAYGGGLGADAVVSGTTYIDLLGGTVNKDIYAGGTSGAVQDYYKAKEGQGGTFTASSTAYIEGGTVRNVYGGGWEGDVGYHDKDVTATTTDILGETYVVIGIREDQTTLPEGYGYYKGVPAIQRNAYSGGEGGSVFGTANLIMNNGYIGYTYNSTTKKYEEKVNDETWTDHVGKDRLSDCGNLFGGGYDDNSSVDFTNVTVWGGLIRNSIFGGGEIATIGRGKTRETGTDNKERVLDAIYKAGGTHIEMYNGHVKRNIFGGGKGYNILGYGGTRGFYTDGYVFGKTEVYVHGGEIGTEEGIAEGDGNVFGGGDVGFVYSKGYFSTGTAAKEKTGSPNHIYYKDDEGHLTEDCKVVISPMLQVRPEHSVTFDGQTYGAYEYVPTDYLNTLPGKNDDGTWPVIWQDLYSGDGQTTDDTEERGVHIHNAVFAGGNVSSNSESYNNAITVFGNTTATLYDVYHHDFITVGTEHTGGLYGGGNLSVVGGYRELNITNYGTDYYGLDSKITLEQYRKMTNRERAYFELEYQCQQDYGDHKAGDRISESEYNKLPESEQITTYWQQFGFCSIYAGRLLNTIQRADFCGVFGSRLVLQGAKDRVADVADATEYTINRIGELSLNKQRSVRTQDTGDQALHGNYFGIYSIVNYLGSLTSDVRFTDPRKVVYTDEQGKERSKVEDPNVSYYDWKTSHMSQKDRNNGTSENQVALASGVFLELTTENSTPSNKIYGEITGIIELDLINVKKDIEGGGYVYAKNEHGARTEHPEYQNVLLSEYNMTKYRGEVQLRDDARTHKSYTYSTAAADPIDCQKSGNFIHKRKRIVDDCYPNNGDLSSPAHYWFIKGEVYIYEQEVSAYAGSATAYRKEVKIPLTITAGSNGRLTLLNVQPSLYAYYANEDRTAKITSDGVKVDNERTTYYLNDVISWWDWHQLTSAEQKLFVKDTYVNVDACEIDGTSYEAGTYVLENDKTLHTGTQPTAWEEFQNASHTVKTSTGVVVTDLTTLFHPSNNVGHDTGYALTFDMNSPKDWNDWYTPINDDAGAVTAKIREEAYDALAAAQQANYREGPTYRLKDGEPSGLYGQRTYAEGEIISGEVYQDYTSTVSSMNPAPTGQAEVDNAYVALEDYGTTQAGNAISKEAYDALPTAAKSNFEPAMVCINTIQLGDEDYVLLGELVSGTATSLKALADKYMAYNNGKTNTDHVDEAGALQYIMDNLSTAYICTTTGLYGGQYFKAGENYSALKAWCSLTESRDKFKFNYDAFDVLIDPTYPGEGHTSVYHDPYDETKPVEYVAVYSGTLPYPYVDNDGNNHTISTDAQRTLSNEDYENILNEKLHYTRLSIAAGGQDVYIVKENFIDHGTPYAKGQDLTKKEFDNLSEGNVGKVKTKHFDNATASDLIVYYCYDGYGDVAEEAVITEAQFAGLKNYQEGFNIQGSEPTETTTLYVSRESNAKDVTKEKIISVVYQYTYYEADDEGDGVSLVNELHVVNIHLQLESGAPEIGPLTAPPAVLPGNSVGMKAPSVNPGLYEILTSGWEMFYREQDAENHQNGVPFTNNGTPLYWYQNQKVFLAFYSKTYLGKTYSNYVPLTVANYHDLDAVMKDKEHHLYVDHPDVERNSKIYIDNRDCVSDATKSELDLLKDFFDLSVNGLTGHASLDEHVKGGADLEFILNSNVSPKAYTNWTPIGNDTKCFEGTLHGDGYTISGLNNSLFGKLCGSVYNLGVTGSFTSAGIVDTGDGYVENCWINPNDPDNPDTPVDNVGAVFGNPSRGSGIQIVNCYYPSNKSYSTSDSGRGLATPMTETQFYNGTVAFNLNGFYLNKRYHDHAGLTSGTEYKYLKANADGTLSETPISGYYPAEPVAQYGDVGYVEDRYKDGDFIYAGGTIPEAYDERMRVVTEGNSSTVTYAPIWPDDYIFFGQSLNYGYNSQVHGDWPTHIVKSGGRLPVNESSNRVYRAPAYYQSKDMSVAHYNLYAYLAAKSAPKTITDNDLRDAYPNMTAIDFAGHKDNTWALGGTTYFYPPLLDNEDGLLNIVNEGETPNLLVYAPSAEVNQKTHGVLTTYFVDTLFTKYYIDDAYRRVLPGPTTSVHGHLVQATLTNGKPTATSDHLLVDKEDFNCPISYTFADGKRMWYQRTPDLYVHNKNQGWEIVSLPFTAELVTTQDKGEITHFYSGSHSIEGSDAMIGHEYWLREYDGQKDGTNPQTDGFFTAAFNYPDASGADKTVGNTFLWDYYYSKNDQKDANADIYNPYYQKDANTNIYQTYYKLSRDYTAYTPLTAAKPYIIGFPGKTYYEFDLSGEWTAENTASPAPVQLSKQTISFVSEPGITINDDELSAVTKNGYSFMPNYMSKAVEKGYLMNGDGDRFVKIETETALVPFRPYFVQASGSPQPNQARAGTRGEGDIEYIIFDGDDSSFTISDEDPSKEEIGTETMIFTTSRHEIIVTSHLRKEADVRIYNISGITVTNFTIQPGETVNTYIPVSGVYIVHAAGGRYQKKVAVK